MARTTRSTFQRARSPEQKQERRENILEGARELAVRHGVRNVTLTMIGERVGLAPSNVLAYFGTREDIYLELYTETWADWTDGLEEAFEGLPPESGKVANTVAQTLAARPLFCDLVAYIPPNYEYNVSTEAVRRAMPIGLDCSARFYALFMRLFSITEQQAFDLNGAIHTFIAWWWQRSHATTSVTEVHAQEPRMPHDINFESGLARWIKAFLDGLLADRSCSARASSA